MILRVFSNLNDSMILSSVTAEEHTLSYAEVSATWNVLILTSNLTNLVCCELSCANLAMAGKIRSATTLVPDRIRSGPIRSTMSDRCWAVHLLTAECRWLKKTQRLSKNSSQELNSSIYVLYQIRHTSFLFSSSA